MEKRFLQLLAILWLAGCAAPDMPPRRVIDAYATAPRQPITVFSYDANVPRTPRPLAVSPHARRSDTGSIGDNGLNTPKIPPPWLPTRPHDPWFYRNDFINQWRFYGTRVYPFGAGGIHRNRPAPPHTRTRGL